jgi:hypothetical protein
MRNRKTVLLFLILYLSAFFLISFPVKAVHVQGSPKLDLVFLLHANQANVPYGDVANDLCYHAVLETMLKHPSLNFPLHFSGTLLTDLAWFNASTLDLLRQGIDSGQFEMIGSTYAQNVIYSHLDDWDNQVQIKKHKQVLKEILDVEPVGFWNPERCWNQSRYVDLISGAGYEYTFVEDHIINESMPFSNDYEEYLVRNTSTDSGNLLIINDDKTIINYIDSVAFTRGTPSNQEVISVVDSLIGYLEQVYQNDNNDDFLVFYGQDMEAWSLWQEEGNFVSDTMENTVARLDYLFSRLEDESDWLNVVTPSEFLKQLSSDYDFTTLTTLPDGTADWMHTPSVNEGYDNWFDFSENDSRLQDYRTQFAYAREGLKNVESLIENDFSLGKNVIPAQNLMSYAEFVFSANQYEFGCIGCYFPWYYRSKTSLITAEAAKYSLDPNPTTEVVIIDLDNDGSNEFILRNNKTMFVFSGLGGRLINWFDIENGIVLLANDIPNTYATWTVNGLNYNDGTSLSSPIESIAPSDLWDRTSKTYRIRPKSFFNTWSDGENEWLWFARNWSVNTANDLIQFYLDFSDRSISKVFKLDDSDNQLEITFLIQNKESIAINPLIGMSFSPGNEEMLFTGKHLIKEDITNTKSHTILQLKNTKTQTQISLTMERNNEVSIKNDVNDPIFAVGYTIELPEIESNSDFSYTMTLSSKQIVEEETTNSTSSKSTTFPELFFLSMFLATFTVVFRKKKKRLQKLLNSSFLMRSN